MAMMLTAVGLWTLSPDTGPDPVAPPPLELPEPVSRPAQVPDPAPTAARAAPRPAPPPTPERATIKAVGNYPPVDPNKVYDGQALRGVAQAAMDRTPAVQDCYRKWAAEYGELDGRFTLNLTVPANETQLRAILPYSYPEGGILEDCVNDVLGDARFTPPDADFTSIWPVPMPLP